MRALDRDVGRAGYSQVTRRTEYSQVTSSASDLAPVCNPLGCKIPVCIGVVPVPVPVPDIHSGGACRLFESLIHIDAIRSSSALAAVYRSAGTRRRM